jgi:hypothetical protein
MDSQLKNESHLQEVYFFILLKIELIETLFLSLYHWNENGIEKEAILKNNVLSVPSSKGRFIYEV